MCNHKICVHVLNHRYLFWIMLDLLSLLNKGKIKFLIMKQLFHVLLCICKSFTFVSGFCFVFCPNVSVIKSWEYLTQLQVKMNAWRTERCAQSRFDLQIQGLWSCVYDEGRKQYLTSDFNLVVARSEAHTKRTHEHAHRQASTCTLRLHDSMS